MPRSTHTKISKRHHTRMSEIGAPHRRKHEHNAPDRLDVSPELVLEELVGHAARLVLVVDERAEPDAVVLAHRLLERRDDIGEGVLPGVAHVDRRCRLALGRQHIEVCALTREGVRLHDLEDNVRGRERLAAARRVPSKRKTPLRGCTSAASVSSSRNTASRRPTGKLAAAGLFACALDASSCWRRTSGFGCDRPGLAGTQAPMPVRATKTRFVRVRDPGLLVVAGAVLGSRQMTKDGRRECDSELDGAPWLTVDSSAILRMVSRFRFRLASRARSGTRRSAFLRRERRLRG
mmetsp:Transcript_7856/g.20255  ORF Transcript_7856/g.20255 Transcript_7856/m.20255 type:complete len:292 (-) Transcript_7856:121-996(-)